jgi:phenylalanyl-tRNA synthetase alpha chain
MKLSDELLSSFHPLEIKVIPYLKDGIKQTELVQISGLQDAEVTRALQWLENKKAITTDQTIQQEVSLDSNGKLAVEKGMPETRFLLAARGGAKTNDDMAKTGLSPQEIGVSIGILKKEGLIEIAQDNSIIVTKKGMVHDTNLDDMLGLLRKLAKAPQQKFSQKENDAITKLKQRKNYVHIKEHKDRTIRLTELGKELLKADLASISFADRVTPEDVASGAWKEKRYRSYDVSLPAPRLHGGKEHFIQEAIDFVNSIWIWDLPNMKAPWSRRRFGILMHYSCHKIILREIHKTHSILKTLQQRRWTRPSLTV